MRSRCPSQNQAQRPAWRTSSYSGAHGDCVEVATNLDATVPVRDTKQRGDASRLTLVFPREAWVQFLAHCKGEQAA
ncbi:DUF397 domain-containing protein [Streptomyces albus]|uniref:DUF397 domain-containing protein n=1 Tax=Streptomyces albus TaxID=1888 RepID=A0A6C1CBW9_9ACTN|nr:MULTISPECIES: DUF397 domain-containing protein [Streptomyces]KPC63514.1 hypothetical protein ADL27_62045 [Streptomyces sp. NRRL F-6602]EPD94508.1 hypothetical protein HMPREF1486_03061 [Streptomyces sp. HPH0547]QID38356.1 DUF397 domain-containing protein [Streptomyces albus]TGG78150.1 DUF397 domain-containing protein [Streptomyces albus]UVN54651.1 DUF397 domain-containing protein [Streptomyces albus]